MEVFHVDERERDEIEFLDFPSSPLALAYLKYLISDTSQRSITAERSNFEDVDAPRIDVVEHHAQSGFMRRLHSVIRQTIARK